MTNPDNQGDINEVSDALEFLDVELTDVRFDHATKRWELLVDADVLSTGPFAGFDFIVRHHADEGWTVAFGDHRHALAVPVDAGADAVAEAVARLIVEGTG